MKNWARNIASTTVLTAAIAAVPHTFASDDGWYVGSFFGHTRLAAERSVQGSGEANTAGIQLGINCCNNLDVEVGYGFAVGADDVDIFSVSAIKYLEADDGSWRPFVSAGLNRYSFNETDHLVDGHQLHSSQWLLGAGAAKRIDDDFFFRAQLRVAEGRKSQSSGTDLGVQFSINHRFGASSKPAAQPLVVAAPMATKPAEIPMTLRIAVEFASDSAVVRSIYSEQLAEVAALLQAEPDTDLLLTGHTDSTGSAAYNQQLSERRAAAVKSYILAQYEIEASRITTTGRGEHEPLESNASEAGRAANRRVVGQIDYVETVAN